MQVEPRNNDVHFFWGGGSHWMSVCRSIKSSTVRDVQQNHSGSSDIYFRYPYKYYVIFFAPKKLSMKLFDHYLTIS